VSFVVKGMDFPFHMLVLRLWSAALVHPLWVLPLPGHTSSSPFRQRLSLGSCPPRDKYTGLSSKKWQPSPLGMFGGFLSSCLAKGYFSLLS
jgi:hypothetical protein